MQVCLFKVSLKKRVCDLSLCSFVSVCTTPPPPSPPPPAGVSSRAGMAWRVRALQAARSFSCILRGCHKTRWAPFNPISEIHSDVGERGNKKRKKCPSSANFTGSKRVAPINDRGPEAAPALAQEQHVSGVGWHHARPASPPTLKQMK